MSMTIDWGPDEQRGIDFDILYLVNVQLLATVFGMADLLQVKVSST